MSSDLCGDLTVVINSTLSVLWSELPSPYFKFPGTVPAYLRSDGEALLPWIITLIIWCFVFTGFTLVIYIQAYVSTSFQPGDVLVWTPLLLIIDAGSMSQMFFLINEDIYLTSWVKRTYDNIRERGGERVTGKLTPRPSAQTTLESDLELPELTAQVQPGQQTEAQNYFIAGVSSILAITFFILILVLQILGLVYATRASHDPSPPLVRWCSPLFQPFGIAVRDGDCAIHPIDQSFDKGIGCIMLPGVQQGGWITGTIWGISISLILELSDVVILSFTSKSTRFRDIKMRRPWCTIIMGLVVLAVMLIFGILYSKGLPEGITSRIWVVVQAGEHLMVYEGELAGAGMRGEVIGWNDALFKSWGQTYFGNMVS